MIYSVTTYLKELISQYLQAFLSDSYILNEEILTGFPSDIRKSFINTFCTDKNHKGVHIPVRFMFNATKNNAYATILIQQRNGRELGSDSQSIGYNMGTTNGENDNSHRERCYMHYDSHIHLAYYQVKYRPNKIQNITNYSGKIRVKNNRIYLLSPIAARIAQSNDNPTETTNIFYTSASGIPHDKRRAYPLEGYMATEDYTIDIISSDIDNIRCLGALIKAVFISMRLQAQGDNFDFVLPKISEANVDMLNSINNSQNSTSYNQLFYKRFTLNYILTYSIPVKFGKLIKNVASNFRFTGIDEQSKSHHKG